jgi:DNA-binding transcriptional LysR family regulator
LSICSKRKFAGVRLRAAVRTGQKLAVEELLGEFPLLHQSRRIHGWQEWFALSNITSPQINIGPRFDLLSMLIAAVRSNLVGGAAAAFAIQHDLDSGDRIPAMCRFAPATASL